MRTQLIKNVSALFVVALVIVTGCNHVYREYDKEALSGNSWRDDVAVIFKPSINNIEARYQVRVGIRYHFRTAVTSFEINIKMVSPSGKEQIKTQTISFRDNLNNHTGDCAGDFCDLEVPVFEDFKFDESGQYQFVIRHNEKGRHLPGIMEVGLIIDEAKS